jgi:signal transduction histidine kinase
MKYLRGINWIGSSLAALLVLGRGWAEWGGGLLSPREVLLFLLGAVLVLIVGVVVGRGAAAHPASGAFVRASAVLAAWLMVNRLAWPAVTPLGVGVFDRVVSMRPLITPLTVSMVAHFALVFPHPHRWLERRPALVWSVVYGQAGVYLLNDLLLLLGLPRAAFWADAVAQISGVILLLVVSGMILVRTRELGASGAARGYYRWTMYCFVGGILPVVALILIPGFWLRQALPFGPLPILSVLALPVGTAIAILVDHALDADYLLRRSVADVGGTLLLGGGFVALVGVIAFQLSERPTQLSLFTGMLVTAVGAVALLRFGVGVIRRVDRAFDRQRFRDRELLERLAARLPVLPTAQELARTIRREIPAALGLRSATLLLVDPVARTLSDPLGEERAVAGEQQAEERGAGGGGAAVDKGLLARCARTRRMLRQQEADGGPDLRGLPPGDRALVVTGAGERIAGVLAVSNQEEILALLLVGPPTSGRALDVEDEAVLRTLASQMAVALQNGRLLQAERRIATYHRSVLAGIATGVVVVDEERCVRSMNRAATAILHTEERPSAGTPLEAVRALQPFLPPIDRALATGSVVEEEQSLMLGGKRRCIGYRLERLRTDGGRDSDLGLQLLLDDITEKRRLERVAAVRSKLEALGQFSGFVVHDVGNIAEELQGSIAQMAPQLAVAPEVARALDGVLARVKRIHSLARSQRDFVRGKSTASEPVDLRALTLSALGSVRRGPRIKIECRPWQDVPLILGDAHRLRRVIENLARNAIQAMGNAGNLRLGVYAQAGAGASVVLEVADDGPGIPPERSDDLFEPFASSRPDGQGLGLAFVLDAVTSHGGRIDVGSAPEGGALFTMTFPAAPDSRGGV